VGLTVRRGGRCGCLLVSMRSSAVRREERPDSPRNEPDARDNQKEGYAPYHCYKGVSYFNTECCPETEQQQESAYNAKNYSAMTAQFLGL
jgi:hypothetical protein